jgi:hypothetical protein
MAAVHRNKQNNHLQALKGRNTSTMAAVHRIKQNNHLKALQGRNTSTMAAAHRYKPLKKDLEYGTVSGKKLPSYRVQYQTPG